MVVGAPYKYNGTSLNEGAVFAFTTQGETCVEHVKLTAHFWVLLLFFHVRSERERGMCVRGRGLRGGGGGV